MDIKISKNVESFERNRGTEMRSVRKLSVLVLFSIIAAVPVDRFLFATYTTVTRLTFQSKLHTTNVDEYDSLIEKTFIS